MAANAPTLSHVAYPETRSPVAPLTGAAQKIRLLTRLNRIVDRLFGFELHAEEVCDLERQRFAPGDGRNETVTMPPSSSGVTPNDNR
jgi:hypothetical protein